METIRSWKRDSRRRALRLMGAAVGLVLAGTGAGLFAPGVAQAQQLGMPEPEEKLADTMKRLFGNRTVQDGAARIKFDAPLIAENGAVVPVRIDADLPMQADKYVKSIYIIADKNRRPLNAKFTLTPEAGKASVATNIRLAATSDVRVIAEMSDGALYGVAREVKVTVGGCGG